jgi:hypothetical protein
MMETAYGLSFSFTIEKHECHLNNCASHFSHGTLQIYAQSGGDHVKLAVTYPNELKKMPFLWLKLLDSYHFFIRLISEKPAVLICRLFIISFSE